MQAPHGVCFVQKRQCETLTAGAKGKIAFVDSGVVPMLETASQGSVPAECLHCLQA